MLRVVWCGLFIVCWLVVRCVVFVVLAFGVFLFVSSCMANIVRCVWFVACLLLVVVSCVLVRVILVWVVDCLLGWVVLCGVCCIGVWWCVLLVYLCMAIMCVVC